MGFGKKKKEKMRANEQKPAVRKVDMSHNPLYPPKKESVGKEVITALGVAVVCLCLTGVIITKFSYAYNPNNIVNQQVSAAQNDEVQNDSQQEDNIDVENDINDNEDSDATGEIQRETTIEEKTPYIIEDSDSRLISASELEGMSAEQLKYARNEIYARHGRRFRDAGLQSYFDSKDWYEGTIDPDQFTENMLNETEKANAETILTYEKSKGYK